MFIRRNFNLSIQIWKRFYKNKRKKGKPKLDCRCRNFKEMSTAVDLSSYRDQHFKGSRNEQDRLLLNSTTLYVGNLSFFTTEEQLFELFGKAGDVKRIIMGLDKFKRTPCGFCFVEYYLREDAENAQRYINGTR